MALYRVTMTTRGGILVYAREPAQDGLPLHWVQETARAGRWQAPDALEVICSLRRENKPARLEACEEAETMGHE